MPQNFYDRVAKKFGGYAFGRGHVKRLAEYPDGNPEKILFPLTPAAATEKGIRFPRHRVVIVAKKL